MPEFVTRGEPWQAGVLSNWAPQLTPNLDSVSRDQSYLCDLTMTTGYYSAKCLDSSPIPMSGE
jgi:hypothetical protein